jgi:prepilin-type N-terminal cleavage/methylation domain-containing protein
MQLQIRRPLIRGQFWWAQVQAFTLTELLVAIAVTAILAAILFPLFAWAAERQGRPLA